MKSFRYRLLIAAMAVLLGSAIAKSQTAADAPPPPPMHGHAYRRAACTATGWDSFPKL